MYRWVEMTAQLACLADENARLRDMLRTVRCHLTGNMAAVTACLVGIDESLTVDQKKPPLAGSETFVLSDGILDSDDRNGVERQEAC